ncbi:MAG: endonuclease [Prevotella sp.]|nr:endonuclease [Prevotella sp.]
MKRKLLLMCMATIAVCAWAQGPNSTGTYYQAADGKKGAELKTALCGILRGKYKNQQFDVESYGSNLNPYYAQTDYTPQNKIWDIYSVKKAYTVNDAISSGKEGDGWNKEHSLPKSWFGAVKSEPMYSDLFHLYPVDAWVNTNRSALPYAKVGSMSGHSENNFSIWGESGTPGVTGKVFEPNDHYKGDLARTYFYMVTCYEDKNFTQASDGAKMMENMTATTSSGAKNTYPGFKEWALNMLMEWAYNDQLTSKEVNRNEAVCLIQHNRNPFIDYPGLEEYIWGSMTDVEFSYDNYQIPEGYTFDIPEDAPDNGSDPGPGPGPGPDDPPTPSDGEFVYARITSTDELEEGAGYIIVCEDQNKAMGEHDFNQSIRLSVSLTTSEGMVATEVNKTDKPYEMILGIEGNNYTFYDATAEVYVAHTTNANKIHTVTSPTASGAQWTITFSGLDAIIKNTRNSSYSLQYNKQSPRFVCYTSSQQPVQLYKRQPVEEPGETTIAAYPVEQAGRNTIIYDLQGRVMGTTANGMPHLKKGIYIINNKKIIIK